LTPFGVQIPQLGLQHDVPGRQIVPPHDSTLGGMSASVSGTGSARGAAGAGQSGQIWAQICWPRQLRQRRCGGRHVTAAISAGSAAGSVSGAACGAHSGQCWAQNSPPLQPTHWCCGGLQVSDVGAVDALAGPSTGGGGHSGQNRAQIGCPLQYVHRLKPG